jgi:hypothetical protein
MLVLLHGLFFDPEVGGDLFLRNAGWLSSDYWTLYPKIQNLKTYTSVFSLLPFKYFVKNPQKRRFLCSSCRVGQWVVSEWVGELVSKLDNHCNFNCCKTLLQAGCWSWRQRIQRKGNVLCWKPLPCNSSEDSVDTNVCVCVCVCVYVCVIMKCKMQSKCEINHSPSMFTHTSANINENTRRSGLLLNCDIM